jgi:hypothetical protein
MIIEFLFIRKHGRYMTKGGYVDSSRRVRSLNRQQNDLLASQNQTPTRGGLLAAINKSSLSSSAPLPTITSKKPKLPNVTEFPSVISISTNLEMKKKEYDKQMRLIEVSLISSGDNRIFICQYLGTND